MAKQITANVYSPKPKKGKNKAKKKLNKRECCKPYQGQGR